MRSDEFVRPGPRALACCAALLLAACGGGEVVDVAAPLRPTFDAVAAPVNAAASDGRVIAAQPGSVSMAELPSPDVVPASAAPRQKLPPPVAFVDPTMTPIDSVETVEPVGLLPTD